MVWIVGRVVKIQNERQAFSKNHIFLFSGPPEKLKLGNSEKIKTYVISVPVTEPKMSLLITKEGLHFAKNVLEIKCKSVIFAKHVSKTFLFSYVFEPTMKTPSEMGFLHNTKYHIQTRSRS